MKEQEEALNTVTTRDLIDTLKILMDGYVKPDLSESNKAESGVVRDTKKVFEYIEKTSEEILRRAGVSLGITRKNIHNDY